MAARGGVTVERLEELATAGILSRDAEGRFRERELTALRYAEAFEASGTPLSALGEAARRGLLYFDTLELLYEAVPHVDTTLTTLADRLAVPVATLEGVLAALGLPAPAPATPLRGDDAELLELLVATWLRGPIWGSSAWLSRAALGYGAAIRHLVRFEYDAYLEAQPSARDQAVLDRDERRRISTQDGEALRLAARVTNLLHARLMEQAIAETSVEVTEGFLASRGLVARTGHGRSPTVAFVDVSGYTALSLEHGDERAATLAARFAELVQLLAQAGGGRLVKLLGDGALLLFHDPTSAVSTTAGIFASARAAGLPDLHAGIHTGPIIERDGDVFGRTVNLAARIAGRAAVGELLVTTDLAALLDPGTWQLEAVGEAMLKGIAEPVALLRVVLPPAGAPRP